MKTSTTNPRICPRCGSNEVYVYDSRSREDAIMRRRRCKACYETWISIEVRTDYIRTKRGDKHVN